MRHEVKYLIPDAASDELRAYVGRYTERDPNGRNGGTYTVRSIYLDTSRGAMYRSKKEGERDRLKVRVRSYGDVDLDSGVRLELKRKRGSTAWKARAHTSLREALDWLGDGLDPIPLAESELAAAKRFKYFVRRHALKPVVLVAYEREALEGLHDPTLRVTFDRSLRGRFVANLNRLGADCPVSVFRRHFILEVKFNHHFPAWLKPALAGLGAQKRALSKYVLTVDACARATHGRRASFSGGRVLRPGLMQTSV